MVFECFVTIAIVAALKRKIGLARTPIKRKSKTDIAKAKEKLWSLCREIIRNRYRNVHGNWNCYTCGKIIDVPAKAQTGHFIPSSACGAYLRYDLRNLRIQDYYCNINLGGNGTEFYRRMVENEGQTYVDQLFKDKQKVVKADILFYLELIERYQQLLTN